MTANEIAELRVKLDKFLEHQALKDEDYNRLNEYWCIPRNLEASIIKDFLEFLEFLEGNNNDSK